MPKTPPNYREIEQRLVRVEKRLEQLQRSELRELMSGYPGGIDRLAIDVGRHRSTLFQFQAAEQGKYPAKTGRRVAEALAAQGLLAPPPVGPGLLRAMWQRQKEKQTHGQPTRRRSTT